MNYQVSRTEPMWYKAVITFSLTDSSEGRKLYPSLYPFGAIHKRAAELFGGWTQYQNVGGWVNAAGKTVQDPGITLVILSARDYQDTAQGVSELARMCAEAFGQEAVCVQLEPVSAIITWFERPAGKPQERMIEPQVFTPVGAADDRDSILRELAKEAA